jgi:hypothetical protein
MPCADCTPVKLYVAKSRRVSPPIELTAKPRFCSTNAKSPLTCGAPSTRNGVRPSHVTGRLGFRDSCDARVLQHQGKA